MIKRFKKTKPEVGVTRVAIDAMMRFNPLRNVSPEYLRQCHDEFDAGSLQSAARLWEKIEDTDDILKVVAAKRKKAVSRHGFEIIQDEDHPEEAKKHAAALQFFYDQLSATRVDDRNVRGGMNMLVRQMMDAVGKKYAVHEIIWKVVEGKLTAEFWFVPLWFFENRTGILRYLPNAAQREGRELEPGGWMVTSGDGVMRACAVAYMFKHLPLQDWLIYSENFGRPIPKGKSTGAPGSDEWVAMEEAVGALANCDGVVINQGSEIEGLDLTVKGALPYPALVERMDRAEAALWRGSDLGTMSKKDAVGANAQGDETDLLEDDDADNITDVLNEQVDKFIIKYMFGTDAPKAWVKIKTGVREDTTQDLAIDKALAEMGYVTPLDDLQRRYNRPELEAKGTIPLANEKLADDPVATLKKNSRGVIAQATAEDLQPLAASLADLLDNTSDDDLADALQDWRENELEDLTKQLLSDPAAATAWEDSLTAAELNGFLGESE